MATATAEPRSVPATEGDGHKHKKNALSDGQARWPGSCWRLPSSSSPWWPVSRSSCLFGRFFQTNTGVDPNTGLIAGGESLSACRTSPTSLPAKTCGQLRHHGPLLECLPQHHLHHHRLRDLETILGVAMALIMAKAFRGRGLVRAGILVPWAIPTIVSALMWKLIFDSSGVMNRILGREILWLADTGASFWAIVIADTWKTAAFIGC